MPNEVKQRKKTQSPKQSEELSETSPANGKDEAQKAKRAAGNSGSALDLKSIICLLSLAACGALTWVVLQQNERFSQIEEKYKLLHGKTATVFNMEEEVLQVSKKCERVQVMLEGVGDQRGALRPRLEGLERDLRQLQEWASGLTEKQDQLQTSLAALRDAVGQIEERTSSITKDVGTKVASVRTDVRRMDGLQSEVESLLAQVEELEDKTAQAERSMVKRIGEVLASSIDRVSNLRASSERNAQAIEQLRRRIPELATADKQISDQLRELERGRARLIRTVTFAGDLKPKVAAIKRDFGAFDPQLSDLTLRIGRLAEDLTKREQDVAELRQTLANLNAVEGDLGVTAKQVSEIADISDVGESILQANVSKAFSQTELSGD
ncbi:inhibitor of nuclear factor kappa-B kinase-interacting protein isoform X2 [Myripristis murdjan]|uniref:IKBKB interacting protein n=1 Tax=Myripristis murdjan TaxID=586833 RepID=A0A667YZ53_9TELE|nr:inhibitor of nuclear factor kappa-B kinase-interacting protein isoform X2 [Myripristis murdjan]XP_029901194.1 inhibitor of nuclear factor kappa-B kinase-interacting protein isoform X2 [Myripristis murdjan]